MRRERKRALARKIGGRGGEGKIQEEAGKEEGEGRCGKKEHGKGEERQGTRNVERGRGLAGREVVKKRRNVEKREERSFVYSAHLHFNDGAARVFLASLDDEGEIGHY